MYMIIALHLNIGYILTTEIGSLYLAVDSTCTAVGFFRLLVWRSESHCQMNSEIRCVMLMTSNMSWKLSCSVFTSTTSAVNVNVKSFSSLKAHWAALISISLALSQTLVFTPWDHGYGASALRGVVFTSQLLLVLIAKDQLNSRFHGRDIFREIGLLPWKTPISVKSVNFSAFSLIYDNSRVLSAAFVQMLLFATCRTAALSSWHWLSWVLT